MERMNELTLESASGLRAIFSPIGAKLLALYVPTSSGVPVQVVIGSSVDPDAPGADRWAGTVCGRFANRIARAAFTLDGVTHHLPANDGPNTLHGGQDGFAVREWDVANDGEALVFSYHSPAGDMGFPGTADVSATYGFDGTTLWLELAAVTDAPTVMNLTHHAYFNLTGTGSALGHRLEIPASHYTPVDAVLIPSGPLAPLAGTRFDFRAAKAIGGSYDHNFCLDAGRGPLHRGARLSEPMTGRWLDVRTTEPGIQCYTGDHFSDAILSEYSRPVRNGGIALEPQTYPNAPNEPTYPSAVLRPGEVYHHRIEWEFGGF
jgi:aldose 1-epimerase